MKMLACPRCSRNNFLTLRSLRRHVDSHKGRGRGRTRTSRDPEKKVERAIGKCAYCKKVVRADIVPHPVVRRFSRMTSTWEPAPAVQSKAGFFAAESGSKKPWLVLCSNFGGCSDGHIEFKPIQFVERAVPTKCNSACRSAKGPKCDCECGGDQHGAAFA